MAESLLYLQESMENYMGNPICERVYQKLTAKKYDSEEAFITELEDEEISYLNALVRQEMRYANNAQDQIRLNQLNQVYERLY